MITYGGKLVLFGGYGDGRLTNELHLFDLKEGEGVSLAVSVELTCVENNGCGLYCLYTGPYLALPYLNSPCREHVCIG